MGIVRRVYKQGNSAVISVPKYVWGQIGAEIGSQVEIEIYTGRMLTITLFRKGVVAEAQEEKQTESQGNERE